jgi:hypothetical protein
MRLSLLLLAFATFAGCTKTDVKEPTPAVPSQKQTPAEKAEELQKHQNVEYAIPEKEILIAKLKAQYEAADPDSESGKALKVLLDKETAELETWKKEAQDTKPSEPEIITTELNPPAKK